MGVPGGAVPGEFKPPSTDLEVALWRQHVSGTLERLAAAIESYCGQTNGTLGEHSAKLDEFGLALARQIAINAEVKRLRDENRVINLILGLATLVAGWFGLRP
jgi:hypothetical protein